MSTHGMSAVSLSDDIGGKNADSVDTEVVSGQRGEARHRSQSFLEVGEDGR